MLHKSSECPEFLKRREKKHLSLTSTNPMWILETGISGLDNNFSVFSELTLAAFMEKVSRIAENRLILFNL